MIRRIISIGITLASILCLCSCAVKTKDSTFSIRFIDVGQGDSALVECDGHYMLIDGGTADAGETVRKVLENNDVRQLDILAISHLHEDHYAGLSKALTYATSIGVTISNSDYRDLPSFADLEYQLRVNGSSIKVPGIGDKYKLGSAEVEVIETSAKENNDSMVLLITYGKTRFLFTGDIEYSGQKRLIEKYHNEKDEPFKVDLVKMPHHGSYTSTTVGTTDSMYLLMRTFMPTYVVISVGAGNPYGHPHRETMELLEQLGAGIYRTDQQGDILVRSNGKELSFETSKSA